MTRTEAIETHATSLARMILTRIPGALFVKQAGDSPFDFVVSIPDSDGVRRELAVVVRTGERSTDFVQESGSIKKDFLAGVPSIGSESLPVAILLCGALDNEALIGWLASPEVRSGEPNLTRPDKITAEPASAERMRDVGHAVLAWHRAQRAA